MIRLRGFFGIGAAAVIFICGSLWGCRPSNPSEAVGLLPTTRSAEMPEFVWSTNSEAGERLVLEVIHLSEPLLKVFNAPTGQTEILRRVLNVFVQSDPKEDPFQNPPMAGRHELFQKRLRFESAFPPTPGLTYWALFDPRLVPELFQEETAYSLVGTNYWPAPVLTPSTTVEQVYPTANPLPENLLKFYLKFSGPMSRGHIYDHIHLLNPSGEEVELPFLEIDEELWDPTMTRLTLFIDPGRIKRGVQPLEEVGPALQSGQNYTLVIDQAWIDARGVALKEAFRKEFDVGASDREPPDAQSWRIEPPASGTRAPLIMTFPEPMDYALARRVIRVLDANENVVPGQVTLEDAEQSWVFAPDQPWKEGDYKVRAESILEDLAGNSLARPFEVDIFENTSSTTSSSNARQSVLLPFTVL